MQNHVANDRSDAEKHPKVLLVSNLENRICLDRRTFLRAAAAGCLAAAAFPLLNGCASLGRDQIKARSPKKVKARQQTTLRKEPTEDAEAVASIAEDEELIVKDYQGNWLKVRTSSGQVGWIKLESVEITEYTQRVLPCGSPLPPGAICLCNCVPTYTCSCNPHTYRTCSCVPVCTCNKIPVYR
jgi:hypothetical protein